MSHIKSKEETKMAKQQMTVYTALTKRKLLEKKLEKLTTNGKYVFVAKKTDTTVDGISREDLENRLKSEYDSRRADIANYANINMAIAQSNATTKLEIAGVEYTVTEAISRMVHINSEITFLNDILKNVNSAKLDVARKQDKLMDEEVISNYITKSLSGFPSDMDPDKLEELRVSIRNEYIANNTYEIIDPYNMVTKIETMVMELEAFKASFNEAISVSNISTIIEVDLIS